MAISAQEIEEVLEPELVQSADRMSREKFCLHMTYRHQDSLGGMSELSAAVQNDYTEGLWRKFHRQLHGPLLMKRHEHEHEE